MTKRDRGYEQISLVCGCGGSLSMSAYYIYDNERVVLQWLETHKVCVPGDDDTIEPSPDLDKRAELITAPELSEIFPEYVADPEADDPEYNIPDGKGELVFKAFGFGFNPIFVVRKPRPPLSSPITDGFLPPDVPGEEMIAVSKRLFPARK